MALRIFGRRRAVPRGGPRGDLLAAIVESSDDAIVSVSLDGTILSWNPAAERIFGHPAREVIGRSLIDLMSLTDRAAYERDLAAILKGERVRPYRLVSRRKDGSEVEVSLSVGAVKDPSGAVVGAAAIIRDDSDLTRAQTELERSRAFLLSVVDNLPAMVIVKELPSGKHVLCNKAGAAMIGRPREEILGKTNQDLFPREEADYFTRKDYEAVERGFVDVPEEPLTGGGVTRLLHTRKMAVRDAKGAATHVVLVAEDITLHRRMERAKDDVLAMASHELKNPLTALAGIVGTLAGITHVTRRDREMLDLAYRTVQRMGRMVSDYLDIERLESGSLELARETLELDGIAREAVKSMEAYAARNRIRFEFRAGPGPFTVTGDPDRLMQVVMNLLSNGGKFTKPETAVDVRVERAGTRVRVSVTDRGPGVPAALQGRMFERFAQSKVPGAREKGSGLGLSISRAIVEKLGGSIAFDSRPGETTFFFELPAAPPS